MHLSPFKNFLQETAVLFKFGLDDECRIVNVIDWVLYCSCCMKDWARDHLFSMHEKLRMCAYQGVRNVSFSEKFAYVLNGWSLNE